MTASRQHLGRAGALAHARSRTGGRRRAWSHRDKFVAARRLQRIYRFSPYIVALLLPGGLALLPLIAWWRHRFGVKRGSSRRR